MFKTPTTPFRRPAFQQRHRDRCEVPLKAIASGATILLPARVDVHAIGAIEAEVHDCVTGAVRGMVIDGSQVKHLDHAGIAMLESVRDLVEAEGILFDLVSSTTLRVAVELTGSDLYRPTTFDDGVTVASHGTEAA